VFKREVSEFATAGQTGKVVFSFDTDASDAPPATKQQMEDTDPHNDCMPCENMGLNLEPSILHGPMMVSKFVRPGGLPGATDIKLYDVGNLNVATQGIASNTEVGELHVNYTVVLEKPVLENLAGAPTNNSVSVFTGASVAGAATTVAYQPLFETARFNPLGIVNTAGSFVVPAGNFLVDLSIVNSNSTAAAYTTSVTTLNLSGAPITGAVTTYTSASGCEYFSSVLTWMINSNGVAPYTVANTETFAAGTNTLSSQMIRFTAI